MAAINPLRGEAELGAGDETYTLTLDVNAFCIAERALGQTTDEIVDAVTGKGAGLTAIRALVWAGLQRQHDDITLAEAGDIVTAAGFAAAKASVTAALAAAFGIGKSSAAEGEDGPRPPGTAPGTGSSSSRGGAKPDSA